MEIKSIKDNKKDYLDLLLIGDEQEAMIDRYLERGDLFLLEENGTAKALCVVTREGEFLYELCNIAVLPECRRKGYGRCLIEFIFRHYPNCQTLQLGTGDSPATLDFYRALGFQEYAREKKHFLIHYDHPIYEGGKQLTDMVRLHRERE